MCYLLCLYKAVCAAMASGELHRYLPLGVDSKKSDSLSSVSLDKDSGNSGSSKKSGSVSSDSDNSPLGDNSEDSVCVPFVFKGSESELEASPKHMKIPG